MVDSFYLLRNVSTPYDSKIILFFVEKVEDNWMIKASTCPGLMIWDKSLDTCMKELDQVIAMWFKAKYGYDVVVEDISNRYLIEFVIEMRDGTELYDGVEKLIVRH